MNHKNKNSNCPLQRLVTAGGLLLVWLNIVGCQPTDFSQTDAGVQQPTKMQVQAAANLPPASTDSRSSHMSEKSPVLGNAIKLASSYSEMRASLQAHGWLPVSDPNCLFNVVGKNAVADCAAHPEWEQCSYCNDLEGLRQCSADGYCLFTFEHKGDGGRLEVTMKGDVGLWRANAPETLFGVHGWRYASQEP